MSVQETATGAPPRPPLTLPALVEGAELIGEYQNSGYREAPHLVRLPNAQLVRLPPLLYMVARALPERSAPGAARDPAAVLAEVAARVSREAGARLTADQVLYLVDAKLAPLGVTSYSDGTAAPVVKANPFLGLRFRTAVLPASATWRLGGLFSWLFHPAAIAAVLAAFLACEGWLVATQSLEQALTRVVMAPFSILLVLALSMASCVFHEIGHCTACRRGGVRPGVMGCGIYLVWPAFYTDITESYRLDRAGRLRTDLGGVYFNAVFVLALTAAYVATGYQPLLVAIVYVNIEIMQQLMPTLRFDGYYIISDLVGIPDLFKYIGPILRRAVLRRPDARLRVLKRRPKLVVACWVLVIVPLLIGQLAVMLTHVPDLVRSDLGMMESLVARAAADAGPLELVASGLQLVLLVLPLAGLVLLGCQLLRWLARRATALVRGLLTPHPGTHTAH
ncbi:hypothetical protein [Actinomadura parmotrematis]|uniref:Peptide zinc metalloprotease protein n=1 Tax=Actinomadura parmotrematis TaxID=2864039 RepID=A0ABS7FQG2_9ACTN|nr:hypothetical protein [Actinomadura parmotrematis]MBW8482205.1 hypothetical protein [Actinomadura parmotrematis]